MTLREYLFKNRISAAKMADTLGVHRNYFRILVREEQRPGYELAVKIELLTGGEVTIQELRG